MSDKDLIIERSQVEQGDDPSVTLEEAMAMLPEGEEVRVFRDTILEVVDEMWERCKVANLLERGNPQRAGGLPAGMGFGLVAFDTANTPVFIETK